MRIDLKNSLGIIVDYQEKLTPVIYKNEKIVNNATVLIKGLETLKLPLIISEQYPKGLGKTIQPIADAAKNAITLPKTAFSCWQDNKIRQAILKTGKKDVILCGIEAHICVLQTAIDLIANGYHVYLVEDCIGSRTKQNKQSAIRRAMMEGIHITTYEAILFELLVEAGSDQFKTISNLIK
ncbi:MAG: hydrolase [Clostridiales bacterium]|nr:hydrolase [Clostridiales bacterium]